MAASPAVAEHLGKDIFYFAKRQLLYLAPAVVAILGVSMLGERDLRRFAIALYSFAFVMLVIVIVPGTEIKGATRWISIFGFTIQPSSSEGRRVGHKLSITCHCRVYPSPKNNYNSLLT